MLKAIATSVPILKMRYGEFSYVPEVLISMTKGHRYNI